MELDAIAAVVIPVIGSVTADDGDDRDDLVVGIPQYADPPAQSPRSGEVGLFYGGSGGLTTAGNELWSQGTAGVTGSPNPEDRFGGAL